MMMMMILPVIVAVLVGLYLRNVSSKQCFSGSILSLTKFLMIWGNKLSIFF